MKTTIRYSRRQFLSAAASTAFAFQFVPSRVWGANERINVAGIGAGGKGASDVAGAAKHGANIVALCDVDERRAGGTFKKFSKAKRYKDFRVMLEKQKDIDAVTVSTPDHVHAVAAMAAMKLGKHVYCQKPLTHSIHEARMLTKAAAEGKLVTQMGNQAHAGEPIRRAVEVVRAGLIGKVTEAHVWTNRPIWRQGMAMPEKGQDVPENLDWDSWVGPAEMRPFNHDPADGWGGFYHPFNWRGFWDFGCGARGDMACHNLDPIYWALEPGYPTEIELMDGEAFGDAPMYVQNTTVRFHFAADGERPAFDLYWHDGGNKPDRPEELPEGENLPNQGGLYIGTKGKLYAAGDSRNFPKLLPEATNKEYGRPEQQIERSADGHHKEWYLACTGEKPYDFPKCNFSYAAPFTEMILLGCIAQRVGGKLEYDPKTMTFKGRKDATDLITKEYREGWDFKL